MWIFTLAFAAFFSSFLIYSAVVHREPFAVVVLILGLGGMSISWSMFPRRFELWPDRLQIVFIASKWDVPLASITDIRKPTAREQHFFFGAHLESIYEKKSLIETRAPKHGLWSLLYSAPDILISARDHEAFIAALEAAWRSATVRQQHES